MRKKSGKGAQVDINLNQCQSDVERVMGLAGGSSPERASLFTNEKSCIVVKKSVCQMVDGEAKAVCARCAFGEGTEDYGAARCVYIKNLLKTNPVTGDELYAYCKDVNQDGNCPNFKDAEEALDEELKKMEEEEYVEPEPALGFWGNLKRILGGDGE